MRFRPSIILTITLLVLSMGLFYEAEARTIEAGHATVSWKGKGVIEDLGEGDRVFSGTLTGTSLVKHLPEGSEPAQIHKTTMDCQTILYISKNVEERKTVLCIVRAHQDKDLAYGEIQCSGKTGECNGEMTWVWGKGGFKGITGTTPFVAGIYIEEQKEGEIYGSAHWPNLTYSLPNGFMPRHGEKGIEELIIALLRGCDPNGVHLTPSQLVPGSTDVNFLACYNKRGKVSAAGGMP